jgi:ssDNA-binding Zn-finger/Zn-ribbon topoisomerase 1
MLLRIICDNSTRSIYERVEGFKPIKGKNQYAFYQKNGKWYGCRSYEITNKLPLNKSNYWQLGNLYVKKVR